MSDIEPLTLRVSLVAPGASPDDLDQLTRRLSRELRDLAQTVSPIRSAVTEEGTKSAGDVFTIGALAIAVAPPVVLSLVELLKLWVSRQQRAEVKVTLKAGDAEVEIRGDIDDPTIRRFLSKANADLGRSLP